MRLCRPLCVLLFWWCQIPGAHAHTLTTRIAQIDVPGATLHEVLIHLHWPEQTPEGTLSITISRADVNLLAEPFTQLHWQCPLRRGHSWQCAGPLRSGVQPPLHLAVDLSEAMTQIQLRDGSVHLGLRQTTAAPDFTQIELTKVPLVWLQQWLATVWPQVRLGEGQLDGELDVIATDTAPLQVKTRFTLTGGALETNDATIAAAGIGLQANVTAVMTENDQHIDVNGVFQGGEALLGSAYLALPNTPVEVALRARQTGGGGWQLPHLLWHDGDTLHARGALGLSADSTLDHLNVHLHSADLAPWSGRYLSGWLGLAGLSGLTLSGALDLDISVSSDGLEQLDVHLDAVTLNAQERFTLERVSGHLIHAASGEHGGELTWQAGRIGEVAFGPAHWPVQSNDGLLRLTAPVEIETLNGRIRLDPLRLRPPHAGQGMHVDFGLYLNQLDLAPLSTALGWPAFRGQLTGVIPAARYRDGWLDLDGGLSMAIFDGRIDVTALMMERPFGVAPTLTLDLTLMNLNLMNITEVFDFGSISGRLDGEIEGLRLVDWSPTAFTADLRTVPGRGARQRISQRAVQDISSVGGGGLMHSIQGRLLSFFKDFGYRRIGLGCRLLNEVCTMSGLHSAGAGFTIVEGGGLPRLNVVGFNREVDWPTLLERLTQIADGAAPVVQ